MVISVTGNSTNPYISQLLSGQANNTQQPAVSLINAANLPGASNSNSTSGTTANQTVPQSGNALIAQNITNLLQLQGSDSTTSSPTSLLPLVDGSSTADNNALSALTGASDNSSAASSALTSLYTNLYTVAANNFITQGSEAGTVQKASSAATASDPLQAVINNYNTATTSANNTTQSISA